MRLYHATDKVGALGIRSKGFAVSHLNDSVDASWFSADPNETLTGSHGEEWLVVVDLPDEVAEQYRHRFPDGDPYGSNFLIPRAIVNQYHASFQYRTRGHRGR